MLSFAAEFPVHNDGDADRFFRTVFDWISGSPHLTVTYPDLERLRVDGHNVLRTDSDVFESIVHNDKDDHLIAFKRITNEKLLQWETIVVLNKCGQETWVGVRTSRVSDTPLNQLPPAKKPIIVKSIIDALGPAVEAIMHLT